MDTPYFNTTLYANITLHPSQMNNDIYKHLKNNLVDRLQGTCFGSYGYISKIYKIEHRSGGKLVAEDNTASAVYDIKFSCKLCKPLKNTFIVCEIITINKSLIVLKNGPINAFVFEGSNINKNNFTYDEKRDILLANTEAGKGTPVIVGSFAKIKIGDSKMDGYRIIVIGTLESMATKQEIDISLKKIESDDIQSMKYEEYVAVENVQETPQNKDTSDNNSDEEDV